MCCMEYSWLCDVYTTHSQCPVPRN